MGRLSRRVSIGVFKRKSIGFVYFSRILLGLAAWQAWLQDNTCFNMASIDDFVYIYIHKSFSLAVRFFHHKEKGLYYLKREIDQHASYARAQGGSA